jgi:hypothetical protein
MKKRDKVNLITLVITCLTLAIGFILNIENLKNFLFYFLVVTNSILCLLPILEFIMKLPMSLAMAGEVSPEIQNRTQRQFMLVLYLVIYALLNYAIFNKYLW